MKRYFENDMTVLFQGDSVTDCGRNRNPRCKKIDRMGDGYPLLCKQIYDTLFPDNTVNFVNRGVSGDRIRDLLTRYDDDFKAVEPDFVSIMIGINDTWRAFDCGDATSPERFRSEYEELLQKIKADFPSTKIMILEQFAFTAHPDRIGWDADLDAKRAVTRELAARYADFFIPIYDVMLGAVKTDFTMAELSLDGVHPAPVGHSLIASEILKALQIL